MYTEWREKEIWNDGYNKRFDELKEYFEKISLLAIAGNTEEIRNICETILDYGEYNE